MKPTNCPKCQGMMEEGFIIDRGHANALMAADWVEGAPEHSFWTGLKTKGKDRYRVVAMRCQLCGFIEHYAPEN